MVVWRIPLWGEAHITGMDKKNSNFETMTFITILYLETSTWFITKYTFITLQLNISVDCIDIML